jgi:hypothetical protein
VIRNIRKFEKYKIVRSIFFTDVALCIGHATQQPGERGQGTRSSMSVPLVLKKCMAVTPWNVKFNWQRCAFPLPSKPPQMHYIPVKKSRKNTSLPSQKIQPRNKNTL